MKKLDLKIKLTLHFTLHCFIVAYLSFQKVNSECYWYICTKTATENCLALAQSSWPKDVIFIREGSVIKTVLLTHCLRTLNRSISQTATSFLGEAKVLLEGPKNKPERGNQTQLGLGLLWSRLDKDYRSCAKYCVMYLFLC